MKKFVYLTYSMLALVSTTAAPAADEVNCAVPSVTGAVLRTVEIAGQALPEQELDATGGLVTYAYDPSGRKTLVTYADGAIDRYSYRMSEVTRVRVTPDGTSLTCAD